MKIRYLLLMLTTTLVLIPALSIGAWTYNQAIKTRHQNIYQHHQFLVANLGSTLAKYYQDTKLIFENISKNLVINHVSNIDTDEASRQLISGLDFLDISLVHEKSAKIINHISGENLTAPATPPTYAGLDIMRIARNIAIEGQVEFSALISTRDANNIILIVGKYNNLLTIAKLKMNNFIALANSANVGKSNHVTIIDNQGNILAHPDEYWKNSRRNISILAPVTQILKGKSGIVHYYSDELKDDVISGFTYVKGPGWGVLINQPASVFNAILAGTWKSYIITTVLSLVFAMVLALWVSIRSTRPLLKLISANRNTTNPDYQNFLELEDSWTVPAEIRQLYSARNEMVNRLRTKAVDTLRMAYSDMVTGLPTRQAFNRLVDNEFKNTNPPDSSYLLVFLDLDEFKSINDTMGHETGDTVLSIVSKQLADTIENYTKTDVITCPLDNHENLIEKLEGRAVISRIGGDEYVALIPWTKSEEDIEEFLHFLKTSISSPFLLGTKEITTSVSIGAALYGRDGRTIRELTKKADIAMYWAKNSGKNCYSLFDSKIRNQTPSEIQIDISNAINNEEMVLYYQPKINSLTGESNSVEALVRWIHPEKGIISPGMFIPAIDNTKFADLLGEWVINAACVQIDKWLKSGRDITVSVNIANHHLVSQNFLPNLLKIIHKVGIDPSYIEIEMTEQTAMTDHERAKDAICALKENGFSVSLDDYGKGYSNLARLAALDIDVIKLDMSLINGITEDPRRAIIVASALDMARNLNCKTVAEGIATKEQANCVSKMGCDYFQGFLFARPMPADELEAWFLRQSVNPSLNLRLQSPENNIRAAI